MRIPEQNLPQIGEAQIKLLEHLSNACAISGDEGEVRKIVLNEVKPFADELKVDALGNVLVTRHATGAHPLRVMLSAHMDEVGLMLIHDDGDGIYRFDVVGSLSASDLVGKAIWIGKEHIPGVIGFKPLHLGHGDDRKKAIELDDLHIDVGLVKGKEKVGDRATFATSFIQLGHSIRGKALDNRLGVASLIELIKHAPPDIELLAAFTVQEEIGGRGARVAAYALNPDLAIVLDSTRAYDLPVWDTDENLRYNVRLDAGPAIYVADASTLYDPRLVQYMVRIAEENGIPYQLRQPGGGGTDAGAIHRQREGIPSISVSVPGRYHHSPASIARLSDWQHTLRLVAAALMNLTPGVLAVER
ncbi:MAG TPA: M20/M25/M40 family metallo-hydrolase [Anaerolineales bacterium]|nr:M20/M25/M40 family metallo-hydrolase [Anaerolineales bacterium]